MISCIIVDDNKLAKRAMSHLVSQVDFLHLHKTFEDPVDAFNYLKKEAVDLVFLDVEMPGMSGLELVKNLDKRPIIILITAKKDYAVEAFELNVADYVVKPVSLSRFMMAVSRAKDLVDSRDKEIEFKDKEIDYIFIRHNSAITKVKINDIFYIKALGDYISIFTSDKTYTVHSTLSGIELKLPRDKFYRLHRSYLAGLNHIDNIEDGTAYIHKHAVPIGEQFRQPLLKKLNFI